MQASLQYQLAQGPVAALWLSTFVLAHGLLGTDEIVEHEGNGHTLNMIIPPHEEGCVTQLDLEYHFEVVDQDRYNVIFDGVKAAIYYATAAPYAEAACDSSFQ
jgi:hypothetical protein